MRIKVRGPQCGLKCVYSFFILYLYLVELMLMKKDAMILILMEVMAE